VESPCFNLDALKVLIDRGCPVDAPNEDGETAAGQHTLKITSPKDRTTKSDSRIVTVESFWGLLQDFAWGIWQCVKTLYPW